MRNRIFRVTACVVMLLTAITLTACAGETEAMQEQIAALEAENTELRTNISSLETELQSVQTTLTNAQNELAYLLAPPADYEESGEQETGQAPAGDDGTFGITYGGRLNLDMSWPLAHGDLPLRVRLEPEMLDGEYEVVWTSTNEDIITVEQSEDGTEATVTPVATGSAEVVVTVGDRETRSWVRITG